VLQCSALRRTVRDRSAITWHQSKENVSHVWLRHIAPGQRCAVAHPGVMQLSLQNLIANSLHAQVHELKTAVSNVEQIILQCIHMMPLAFTQQATATLGLGATASLGIGASLEASAAAAGMESQVGASLLAEKQDGSLGGEVTATMDILAGLDTAAQVKIYTL